MSKINNINIIKDFIPAGRRNRPDRTNPMTFVTIHNTGNTSKGSGARNHAVYIKGDYAAGLPVSWHYTADEKDIIQHLPDNETAFHAGDGANGSGNTQSIGIEICMNSDGNIKDATDNAVLLTAYLCKTYNIAIQNVVQHNRWTGKNCPQMIRSGKPYDWNTFINKVKECMGISVAATAPTVQSSQPVQTAQSVIKQSSSLKSIDEIAREVIAGRWGNGEERIKRLTTAGYSASAVQTRVNTLLR